MNPFSRKIRRFILDRGLADEMRRYRDKVKDTIEPKTIKTLDKMIFGIGYIAALSAMGYIIIAGLFGFMIYDSWGDYLFTGVLLLIVVGLSLFMMGFMAEVLTALREEISDMRKKVQGALKEKK